VEDYSKRLLFLLLFVIIIEFLFGMVGDFLVAATEPTRIRQSQFCLDCVEPRN